MSKNFAPSAPSPTPPHSLQTTWTGRITTVKSKQIQSELFEYCLKQKAKKNPARRTSQPSFPGAINIYGPNYQVSTGQYKEQKIIGDYGKYGLQTHTSCTFWKMKMYEIITILLGFLA